MRKVIRTPLSLEQPQGALGGISEISQGRELLKGIPKNHLCASPPFVVFLLPSPHNVTLSDYAWLPGSAAGDFWPIQCSAAWGIWHYSFKDHGSLFLPLSLVGHGFGKTQLYLFLGRRLMEQYKEPHREKSWSAIQDCFLWTEGRILSKWLPCLDTWSLFLIWLQLLFEILCHPPVTDLYLLIYIWPLGSPLWNLPCLGLRELGTCSLGFQDYLG